MKIGIDARFFGPYGKGLGRYTQKLILNLEKIDQDNQYYIFLRTDNFGDYQPQNLNFHKVKADYPWYSLAEQFLFPWLIRKYQLDLMHFPHFNVPIFYWGKMIVTIHDLIITNYPTRKATTLGPLKYRLKHAGYKIVIWLASKRAASIITVSKYSKQQIVKHFSVNPDKIHVTYEACDAKGNEGSTDNILTKYKISQPYLLYVGNVYPHKNIETLLSAFSRLSQERDDLKLVLVGKGDYFYQRIKRQVDELNLIGKVIFTGFVPDDDLLGIYRKASLYVFPSLEEGFGLPPLEAMAQGIPVICSNNSCLPEVLGGAVHYFDPKSTEQIISSVKKVLDDDQYRHQLIQRGSRQVKKYSWQFLADKTRRIYQNVLY
ncbi:glycosyltransferase family 4 protein [Patescibacteria group bacterium]|nr:glycosyltransferase family 4 protein [Patescibacteria group bacterium]